MKAVVAVACAALMWVTTATCLVILALTASEAAGGAAFGAGFLAIMASIFADMADD